MGLAHLRSFLNRHHRIAIDTSPFIYAVEANPRYIGRVDSIFAWLDHKGHSAVTSTITMLELLVLPYRNHDQQRVDEFYGLLSTYPNLDWIAPDLEIADLAARLRAQYALRTPDGLQAATAMRSQATGFVTNDRVFARVAGFESLILDEAL